MIWFGAIISFFFSVSVEEDFPVVLEGEVVEEGEEEKTFTRPRFVQVRYRIHSGHFVCAARFKLNFPKKQAQQICFSTTLPLLQDELKMSKRLLIAVLADKKLQKLQELAFNTTLAKFAADVVFFGNFTAEQQKIGKRVALGEAGRHLLLQVGVGEHLNCGDDIQFEPSLSSSSAGGETHGGEALVRVSSLLHHPKLQFHPWKKSGKV